MKPKLTMAERAEAAEKSAQEAREAALRMFDQRSRDAWLDIATRHRAAAKRLRAGLEPIEPAVRTRQRKSYAQLRAERERNTREWNEGWLQARNARQRARKRAG